MIIVIRLMLLLINQLDLLIIFFWLFQTYVQKYQMKKKSADWSLLKKTAPDWVAAVAAAAVTMSQNRIFMPF